MKTVDDRRRLKKKRFQKRASSNTYSLSTAKTYLGRLVNKAKNGEAVYILRGHERFSLQPVPEIEPIPMRPVGYFEFDSEDRKLDKQFAKVSVVPQLRSE